MIVEVEAYARLHMGLFELGQHFGRRWGGVGVSIKQPSLRVTVNTESSEQVEGIDSEEAENVVTLLCRSLGKKFKGGIKVQSGIPVHRGFGSRTQLRLALATAICKAMDVEFQVHRIAEVLGIGEVSSVGTHLFANGGLVVQLPRQANRTGLGSFIRLEFPEDWWFVVAYPGDVMGLDEQQERRLFATLPPQEPLTCMEISHLILGCLLPTLLERDLTGFGECLSILQRLVGQYFASVQGGVFRMAEAVQLLRMAGAKGVGQSSWGPAVYGLFGDRLEAENAVFEVRKHLGDNWNVYATTAVNHGARVSVRP
ncbi:beta-ribofuranosylaminobenzene 5'-phosphate synthase [Candidatus Caldarchaeum subterraneum]|uniref:Beta-ribofuranosylaminobenzene 5'-phosphate synthase n=1 Tax=Caldiarchaeum subterraneum TaxID=311458 RepID=E6N7Q8_CALS0|nr:beta-ribofuranosylaminobenzene 5'-phosphate synthase [Candidatus Caldarchaeum subterraneum]BAJ51112.1 beta-ribofuranosylaminobenzene 5'-phosphate synthase [Candidatus Caldarchaeum subterraneum]